MEGHFVKATVVAAISAIRPFRLPVAALPFALRMGPGCRQPGA